MQTKCGQMQPTRATLQPAATHGKNPDLAGWPWLAELWRQWYSRPSKEARGLRIILPSLPSRGEGPFWVFSSSFRTQRQIPIAKCTKFTNTTLLVIEPQMAMILSGKAQHHKLSNKNTLKQEGCQFIDEQTGKNANTKSYLGMDKQHSHTLMGSV